LKKLVVLFLLLVAAAEAAPPTAKIDQIPDLPQVNIDPSFAGDGKNYCAPVSVSNSLIWLSQNGFPRLSPGRGSERQNQIEIIRKLASPDFMDTDEEEGTSVENVLYGVETYVTQAGYKPSLLAYQGWRPHPEEFSTGISVPELSWIIAGIEGTNMAWLNIGFYTYDEDADEYERMSGHWVTLVGHGVDGSGKPNPNSLIIHDPSPRTDDDDCCQHLLTVRLTEGTLIGRKKGLPRSAAGFLDCSSGLAMKRGADCAIVDGVVVLKL